VDTRQDENTRIVQRAESMVRHIKTDKTAVALKESNLVWTEIHNTYIGIKWTMPNGLKVTIKQGDLVNETSEVIGNPANQGLQYGVGAAHVIAMAAETCLQDECRHYIKHYGGLNITNVVHSTAGNLRPRINYVLYAVGPDAQENRDRQDCLELVQKTILNCLDLNSCDQLWSVSSA